jgi:hypothetical protein
MTASLQIGVAAAATAALAMAPAARVAELQALSDVDYAQQLRATPPEQLIALGREAVRRLGTYRARVVKEERIGDRLLPAQTLEITVQPSPLAMRVEYLAGPKSGRKLVWTQRRPKQMLVREGGVLGVVSLWLDVDGSLAHRDTNHRVAELGFAPLLDIVASDLRKAAAFGGHQRRDEGFDVAGHYCMVFTAPAAAEGLYARRTRLCIDKQLALPVRIEVDDRLGLLERYQYSQVRPNQRVDPALFETL